MKRPLKYFFIILALLLIIATGFVSFVSIRGIPKYASPVLDLNIVSTPQKVEHGKKLAAMLCVHCHLSRETNKLTGRYMEEMTKDYGTINSKNITSSKVAGIGSWTDGELVYFLRTGIKPDGQYVPPYMPKLVNISDDDMESIIAWVRSDDPMLATSEEEAAESDPSFLTKMLCTFVFKPFKLPEERIVTPPLEDRVAYGKYLVTARLTCFGCHSKNFRTNDYNFPEKSKGFLAGGNVLLDLEGRELLSSNITMDKVTGIGNYTEDGLVNALKYGMKPDGTQLSYPMVPYPQLTGDEIKAIYAYLKTVTPVNNKIN